MDRTACTSGARPARSSRAWTVAALPFPRVTAGIPRARSNSKAGRTSGNGCNSEKASRMRSTASRSGCRPEVAKSTWRLPAITSRKRRKSPATSSAKASRSVRANSRWSEDLGRPARSSRSPTGSSENRVPKMSKTTAAGAFAMAAFLRTRGKQRGARRRAPRPLLDRSGGFRVEPRVFPRGPRSARTRTRTMRNAARCAAALLALAACNHAQPAPTPAATAPQATTAAPATDRPWIARSNENAKILLAVQARFSPEQAARVGQPGLDDRVTDLTPGHQERLRKATGEALARIEELRRIEKDPLVAQDLAILADAAQKTIRGSELSQRLEVPYYNLARLVFASVRGLLDPQIAPARRPAALVRVRKYAGLEPGTTSIVELAERETRDGLARPGLQAPSKIQVENDLQTAGFSIDGIEKVFQEYKIPGYEQPVAELKKQLTGYVAFVRREVLPRARDDFRL